MTHRLDTKCKRAKGGHAFFTSKCFAPHDQFCSRSCGPVVPRNLHGEYGFYSSLSHRYAILRGARRLSSLPCAEYHRQYRAMYCAIRNRLVVNHLFRVNNSSTDERKLHMHRRAMLHLADFLGFSFAHRLGACKIRLTARVDA